MGNRAASEERESFGVLFVCLGNICRSPTAEGLFRRMAAESGLAARVRIDSAGTGHWHVGSPPDRRTQEAARARGVDLSGLRARQVSARDFHEFELLVAMDRDNHAALEAMRPSGEHRAGPVRLMLEFSEAAGERGLREVPDPYSGGADGFSLVYDLVEDACRGLLAHVAQRVNGVGGGVSRG